MTGSCTNAQSGHSGGGSMHLNQELGRAPGACSGESWQHQCTVPITLPAGARGQSGEGSPTSPALPWQNVPVKPGLQLQTGLSSITWQPPWCWQGFGRQVFGLLWRRRATPRLGPCGLTSSPAAKEK